MSLCGILGIAVRPSSFSLPCFVFYLCSFLYLFLSLMPFRKESRRQFAQRI